MFFCMAEEVDYSEDRWYHAKETNGRGLVIGGLAFSLTGVGLIVGIPLILIGIYQIRKAPGPIRNVELEENEE